MNNKLIRLTEQDLHRIVKESVSKIVNEAYGTAPKADQEIVKNIEDGPELDWDNVETDEEKRSFDGAFQLDKVLTDLYNNIWEYFCDYNSYVKYGAKPFDCEETYWDTQNEKLDDKLFRYAAAIRNKIRDAILIHRQYLNTIGMRTGQPFNGADDWYKRAGYGKKPHFD